MLTFPHPRNDRKTRQGKTILIDMGPSAMGWTGRHGLSDLLEAAGNFIDYAKIWALNAIIMPDGYLRDVIRLYRDHEIPAFAGGLLFEYAYRRNEVDGMIKRLHAIGLSGIELSENYVTLADNERLASIQQLRSGGLDVVYEYGQKLPDSPLDLGELDEVVRRVLAAGAHHVIIEQGEIDLLAEQRPEALEQLKAAPWFKNIYIEIQSSRYPKQHVEAIRLFGPEVNLANVAPSHVIPLEGFRRGLGREIDFPFFREGQAGG